MADLLLSWVFLWSAIIWSGALVLLVYCVCVLGWEWAYGVPPQSILWSFLGHSCSIRLQEWLSVDAKFATVFIGGNGAVSLTWLINHVWTWLNLTYFQITYFWEDQLIYCNLLKLINPVVFSYHTQNVPRHGLSEPLSWGVWVTHTVIWGVQSTFNLLSASWTMMSSNLTIQALVYFKRWHVTKPKSTVRCGAPLKTMLNLYWMWGLGGNVCCQYVCAGRPLIQRRGQIRLAV